MPVIKGGVKQRLGLGKPKAKVPLRNDPLAAGLLDMYSAGDLAAGQVGALAAAASSSSSAPLQRLSKSKGKPKAKATAKDKGSADTRVGSSKHQCRNSSRALLRAMARESTLPLPYTAEVKVWDNLQEKQVTKPMAFMPIHDTLEAVVEHGGLEQWGSYDEQQRGFEERLKQWGQRVGVPQDDLSSFLPISLWGDSAEYNNNDSLYMIFFTVLSGLFRRRFWVCGFNKRMLCKCGCYGRHTYDDIWAVIAWMFRALLLQRHPSRDHTGKRFPKGSHRAAKCGTRLNFGGACIAKCGDWAWFKAVLGLRGWRGEGSQKQACWLCGAGFNDEHNCFDFTKGAAWRRTMTTMEEFWSRGQAQYISGIWAIPGFHLGSVRPDWMHMCCLGVLQYLIANCLWECFIDLGGVFSRPKLACAQIEYMIETIATHLGLEKPLHSLTITMIRPSASDKPKFKGKAAVNRHFLPILLEILHKCFPLESEHQQTRFHCVSAIHEAYREMEQWDPRTSPSRLGDCARRHLILWAALKEGCDDPLRWCLYPKHHMWLHCAEQCATNPRLEWNYSDESEIGHATRVAAGCNVLKLAVSVMEHYRAGFKFP